MKTKRRFSVLTMIFTFLLACQLSSQQPVASLTEMPHATFRPTVELSPELMDAYGMSMVLVPEGEFTMGSDAEIVFAICQEYYFDCHLDSYTDGAPPHQVYLNAYYLDKYEVSNSHYKACVDVDICAMPTNVASATREIYFGISEFDNHPVIYVDWDMAKTYCEWRGAYLPTEAQWEKAARGTDGRLFPWGDEIYPTIANYLNANVGDTVAANIYDMDRSPYGAFNLGGNVSEWVADWYSATYYQNSPFENPQGPETGELRVVRGGSWNARGTGALSVLRREAIPSGNHDGLGFRCARDATQ